MDNVNQSSTSNPPQNHQSLFWVALVVIFVFIPIFFRIMGAKRRRQFVAVTFSRSPRQVESGLNRDLPPAYTQSPPPPTLVYPAETHTHVHHHCHTGTTSHFMTASHH
ncbi:hypothetical protein F5887DRAFT_915819 [Amanita rubescens]|nr:hypothetical protein F5887DRAFT_915819 [Amanita rubescens]